ncbi:superfamily II DNA or RNA helicase [Lachnospiraceae bacterium PFB1-21]
MSTIANRTTTNFEFLLLDWDLKEQYYDRAKYIEDFYVAGEYDKVIEQGKKFESSLVNTNIIAEEVEDYSTGNLKEDALTRLKILYQSLKQISINSGQPVKSVFQNPLGEDQYQTNERKLIYVQTADNSSGNWGVYAGSEKIGDATADATSDPLNFQPNSEYLRKQAEIRINSYMTTSGVPFITDWAELAYRPKDKQNPWFRDHDVHEVLRRSGYKRNTDIEGNEWWKVSLDTAKAAISAVKENREAIDGPVIDKSKIVLRPEQVSAINQTKKVFKTKDRMLWNAKMRFGKTLSAYQLIKDENYRRVLILTHRPVVSDSWFEDFGKLEMGKAGYTYRSRTKGMSIESLTSKNTNFVYFASMQDLRGSSQVGGKQGEKNELVFSTNWDLIVFDEAHEGTQTELAQNVEKAIKKDKTKILELSGTPFNLLEQYTEDQVFTWDYVMEQEAKLRWATEKPGELNPYETLPKVNMFTFEMGNKEKYADESKAFNFKEFFRVKDDGTFEHEADVNKLLSEITKPSATNYPYSTEKFRNELRHSLWLLPGIAEAKALKDLMDKHPIFGTEYKIVNVVDKDDKEITGKDDPDLGRVRAAISDKPWETKTITLTVRKLTTGVNVKEWTSVMFMNNTTSAMNYLQAAFRAQTPYSNEVQGQKTNVYIFDFAPDRALTVMAESASINSGVGKRNTPEQKQKMAKLLNFLPILGIEGNKMQTFSVDRMLTQLKKVYAEKAVRSGFDDDSLYSDALLTINPEAAALFEKLRGIVGKTGAAKNAKKVDINNQGLTDEEHERAEKGKRKKPKDRTLEELAAIEKQKKAKKERKNAISILRGISIRIPLMIFGMGVDIAKDIDIETFVNEVDDVSWEEFMPTGVTKEMFKEQAKYYDPEVFIEAGRLIRSRAKSYDDLTYTERAEQIALLHGTFKNPDKETVLTPWRVVNRQLVSTIGGLSFYNGDFSDTTIDGTLALHWVEQLDTADVFRNDGKVLEINSKTGLYPLYAATSFFYKKQMHFIDENSGKINKYDEERIIQEILKDNVYVIAKTPMAKTITQRTLAGYKNWQTNIVYVENLTNRLKSDASVVEKKIQKEFGVMKFDAVVGNPPYQENNSDSNRDQPLYPHFYDLAEMLSNKYALISPGRFLFGIGATSSEWNNKMLSDDHIKVIQFEQKSDTIFPNTDIKGGVAILYRDANRVLGPIGTFTPSVELNYILKKVEKKGFDPIGNIIFGNSSYKLTETVFKDNPEFDNRVSKSERKSLGSNAFDRYPELFSEKKQSDDDIAIYGRQNNDRTYKFLNKKYIQEGGNLYFWKVIVPGANGSGNLGEILSTPVIGHPGVGHTQTFISLGKFDIEYEAESLLKYLKSKFTRTMLGIKKTTQNNKTADTWSKVPMQDFTESSDIDWTKSISEIDQQLYKKYALDQNEINFIEETAIGMD